MNLEVVQRRERQWLAGRFFKRPGAVGMHFDGGAVESTCSVRMARISLLYGRAKIRSSTSALLQQFARM